MVFSVSVGRYSDRHIEQVVSSALTNRKLSPRTVVGYDCMMDSSSPTTETMGCCCTAGKVDSARLRCVDFLSARHAIRTAHVNTGTVAPSAIAYFALLGMPGYRVENS